MYDDRSIPTPETSFPPYDIPATLVCMIHDGDMDDADGLHDADDMLL